MVGDNLSVDGQDFVAVFDGIARQSDDALDVVHFRLDGVVEHDDVAALDLSGRNQDLDGQVQVLVVLHVEVEEGAVVAGQTPFSKARVSFSWYMPER